MIQTIFVQGLVSYTCFVPLTFNRNYLVTQVTFGLLSYFFFDLTGHRLSEILIPVSKKRLAGVQVSA